MRHIAIVVAVVACTAAAGALATTAQTTASPSWSIHDLGTLRGLDAAPVAMNERGDIAGYAFGRNVAGRAFVWTHGRIVDLGRCGADSRALAINAAGTAVGSCGLRPGGKAEHAFLWRDGKATDLGAFGWSASAAVAIDDRGDVAGDVYRGNTEHAFLWRRGRMTDLGTLGGARSEAIAINARGQVAGDSTTADGRQHAFLWQRGTMTDLGTLGGATAASFGGVANEQFVPTAMNDRGQVVGLAHDPVGSFEAGFVWQNGKLTTLGDFGRVPNRAIAVNARGQVLVQTTPPTDKRGDAYVWSAGKLTKLSAFSASVPATFAHVLNDAGAVAGSSLTSIGHSQPFVWQNGRLTRLRTLTGQTSAPTTSVSAINDHGRIAGSSYITVKGHTEAHLVVWTSH